MKKKVLISCVCIICLAIIAAGSYAFTTRRAVARNVITTGAIEITVVEQQLEGGKYAEYTGEDKINILPTQTVSKIVSVRNEEKPAYIRMKYSILVKDPSGNDITEQLDSLYNDVVISANDTDWTSKDGWWYYNDCVEAGEVTEPLFYDVAFSGPGMGNIYQDCTVEICVHAQAVQMANNPAPDGDTTAVSGWPAEQ